MSAFSKNGTVIVLEYLLSFGGFRLKFLSFSSAPNKISFFSNPSGLRRIFFVCNLSRICHLYAKINRLSRAFPLLQLVFPDYVNGAEG